MENMKPQSNNQSMHQGVNYYQPNRSYLMRLMQLGFQYDQAGQVKSLNKMRTTLNLGDFFNLNSFNWIINSNNQIQL